MIVDWEYLYWADALQGSFSVEEPRQSQLPPLTAKTNMLSNTSIAAHVEEKSKRLVLSDVILRGGREFSEGLVSNVLHQFRCQKRFGWSPRA